MKSKQWILVFLILILHGAVPRTPGWSGEDPPRVTQWMGPDEKPLHTPFPSSSDRVFEAAAPDVNIATGALETDQGRICIVVGQDLYSEMAQSLLHYQADLYSLGYASMIHMFSSGTPESLRDYLALLYEEEESLVGAVFVGDIPYIVYEMMQTWVTGGTAEYEDFPCDIFYMDLNGVWSDSLDEGSVRSGNGKYDTREGDLDLEIWVSRIRTDNLSLIGSEKDLMISYFDKNHRYRRHELVPGQEALVYNDDDWGYMAASDADRIGWVYGDSEVTAVFEPEDTTAFDFKTKQLTASYEFMSLRSHGWTGGHGFYRNGSTYERVYSSDYEALDPEAVFYSLFVCSGSDYTVNNNLAGTIAFNPDDSGLLVVGTTKKGGMWNESRFYEELSSQIPFGEAFRLWFNSVLARSDAPRWWYGMVLLGDGALMRSGFMTPPCFGDSDGDQDADGLDLSAFILSSGAGSSLDRVLFSENFGKTDCL